MALCNYLSNEDKSIFCNWINMYGGMSDNKDPDLDVENVDHILRFWDKEKVTLWKMLGEKFTISKDVTFKRSERQSRSDFEDCLQMECARDYGAKYIVTRNIADYEKSEIKAISPSDFLKGELMH